MLTRRSAIAALAIGLLLLGAEAAAQPSRGAKTPSLEDDKQSVPCPNEKCGIEITFENTGPLPTTCPHCSKTIKVEKTDSGYRATMTSADPMKKWLLIGGGIALGIGLIGVILKYTVLAPAKPKKKNKKRREDDFDEGDDRPKKKKRPIVVEDDEDDTPRKMKKKPRIVDDDDE